MVYDSIEDKQAGFKSLFLPFRWKPDTQWRYMRSGIFNSFPDTGFRRCDVITRFEIGSRFFFFGFEPMWKRFMCQELRPWNSNFR